jgi:hypothetical protein
MIVSFVLGHFSFVVAFCVLESEHFIYLFSIDHSWFSKLSRRFAELALLKFWLMVLFDIAISFCFVLILICLFYAFIPFVVLNPKDYITLRSLLLIKFTLGC